MKKIILAGPAASGKDHFAGYLIAMGLKKGIDFTTRPKRNDNDNDYKFVSGIPRRACYFVFNVDGQNWRYGFSKKETLDCDFIIRPPVSIVSTVNFIQENNEDYFLVYFDIPSDIRIERMNDREDADATERRLKTDREDFTKFAELYNPNVIITDPDFNVEVLYNMIKKELV